jgi:hypothetical protein
LRRLTKARIAREKKASDARLKAALEERAAKGIVITPKTSHPNFDVLR